MHSKRNFWKVVGGLLAMCVLAGVVAGTIIPIHQKKIRFDRAARITGGDPYRGKGVIERNSCGVCHTIPGIKSATAQVAPDLTLVRKRPKLAGGLKNTPDNMKRWIMDPHSIDHQTSMPNMRLSESDTADIVAYLYTLE